MKTSNLALMAFYAVPKVWCYGTQIWFNSKIEVFWIVTLA
jgi:hypothetical protein